MCRTLWNCIPSRPFVVVAAIGVVLSAAAVRLHGVSPNIVFLFADDMGYGDPRCFNSESKIATPNIDRLAGEGMRFTDAHAPASVCVPSRYGLLTGRYPFRTTLKWRSGPVIDANRVTIASLLGDRGYATAMVGKWHQGFEGGIDHDYAKPLGGGPMDRGFDRFFGMPASLDIPPYFFVRNRRATAAPTGKIEASHSEGWSDIQGAFWRAGGIGSDFKHEEVTPRFAKEAIAVIDEHVRGASGKPLFLYLALPSPHTPWLALEKFRGKSGAGMYGDFVMQVDEVIGQVLAALDEHGMTDNTLVFFSSDNGPVWFGTDAERFGHRSVKHLRGMKGDAWEGGHRMPLIARWPGHVESGGTNDQLICFTDMLATFAALTGGAPPVGAGEDSVSFLPALVGKTPDRPMRDELIWGTSARSLVVRKGPWKMIPFPGSGGFIRASRPKPEAGGPTGQLYNLADDPGETRNLWQQHGEKVKELQAMAAKYRKP